ncbi:MAG: DUF4962 domain-containing protein [Armatimonadota bacterium]|nr:DUF4962 domain-containing protein [Armatimonadota bacterium]
MREMLLAALVVGPFSGVDIEHLTDTPILGTEPVVEVAGEDLLEHGEGMELQERDGQPVVVATDSDFYVEIQRELAAGEYSVVVEASAPNKGTDSFWVVVDGEQGDAPLTLPRESMDRRAGPAVIREPGQHSVRLILREGPGCTLRSVSLRRNVLEVPREPMLPELADQHPRMFFTADDIDRMRARLQDPVVQQYYSPAGPLDRDPPQFKPGQRNGGAFRRLPTYALSHVLEPSQEKLDRLLVWLEMAATYPHVGADLDAEYFMEGVALTYDWIYQDIPEDLRADLRELFSRQARHVYELSLNGRTGGGLSFQQNHYWFAHLSLVLASAAVYGEVPEAREWLAWAWDRTERIFITFSPDGGFHEGPAYWDFSMPTLYMLVDLYEQVTGLQVPWADQGLHGQAVFRFHHVYPGLRHSATLEDTTVPKGGPPIRLILWEAKRYQDPVVQGIAEVLNGGPSSTAYNLLWLDESLEPQSPTAAVPVAQYYPDIETAFARSSWRDGASYAVLVSRPLGGHLWAELCARYGLGGTGHNHPEQGHFVLFGRGEVLAHDPGYTYEKMTRNHNTILVDGQGQYGDGEMWPGPKPGRATITGFATEGGVTIIEADPSSAYPEELGLTRFDRTFVLAGRDLAVCHDRLAANQPRTFSWLLHHIGQAEEVAGGWRISRGEAQLGVMPLQPGEYEAESGRYLPDYVHPTRDHTPDEDAEIGLLELRSGPVQETTFLVPMLIGDAGDEPPEVVDLSAEGIDAVRVGETVVAFNRGESEMTVPLPDGRELRTDARTLVLTVRDGEQVTVELARDATTMEAVGRPGEG